MMIDNFGTQSVWTAHNYINSLMLSPQQLHKHSQTLFNQLQGSDTYNQLKNLLFAWKESSRNAPQSITTFLKILHVISNQTPQLLDDLNRCLIKDYVPSDNTPPSLNKVRRLAIDNPNAGLILDSVLTWLRTQQPPVAIVNAPKTPQLQELSENQFLQRLQKHQRSGQISKIIYLYRRCILTVGEFKKMLEPIYLTDPSFFNMLFQYAEELQTKRRKVTIFAPLNQLVDQKYPLEQVGNSYINIPDGYANWGHSWNKNVLEVTLNRSCVSVPLGTQGSFLITRKNEFEQQLLRNQEQKYQIDSNLVCLQAAIKLIQKSKKITHPLVQRILAHIYPGQVLSIMMRNPNVEVARSIVIPRLKQKLAELGRCRFKFEKVCEQVAGKNFYKSLDYRCFYFCKNDKKFNCPARWQKQIELRKRQVLQEETLHVSCLQIEDRESLQHSRYYVLNSFDNITTQQLLPERKVQLGIRRTEVLYPRFPNNQVLFLIDFSDRDLLNDVLQILLYHTQKKSLLELMIFKMMRLSIDRKLQKQSALLHYIEGRSCQQKTSETLNELKTNRRVYKDITDEFLQLIEEEIEPAQVQQLPFPFEGPEQHTFIATKQCYLFLRYLATLYQRFARAKTLSQQRGIKGDEPSLYSQFLTVLVHKIKQQKGLEQYLRKIFQQDAFIFFTLDKLVLGQVKLINNINTDSLTYKLLREGVKDYDLEIRRWQDYPHPSVTEQLARLYRQNQMLFRFTYSASSQLIYVSSWDNTSSVGEAEKKKKEGSELAMQKHILPFLNSPVTINPHPNSHQYLQARFNQYVQDDSGGLVMLGEERLVGKRRQHWEIKQWELQAKRLKKIKLQ